MPITAMAEVLAGQTKNRRVELAAITLKEVHEDKSVVAVTNYHTKCGFFKILDLPINEPEM